MKIHNYELKSSFIKDLIEFLENKENMDDSIMDESRPTLRLYRAEVEVSEIFENVDEISTYSLSEILKSPEFTSELVNGLKGEIVNIGVVSLSDDIDYPTIKTDEFILMCYYDTEARSYPPFTSSMNEDLAKTEIIVTEFIKLLNKTSMTTVVEQKLEGMVVFVSTGLRIQTILTREIIESMVENVGFDKSVLGMHLKLTDTILNRLSRSTEFKAKIVKIIPNFVSFEFKKINWHQEDYMEIHATFKIEEE